MVFSLDVLSKLLAESAVRGLAITRELQPLGGSGDAVSPPTFAQAEGDEKGPRYVWSERRVADETVRTCLLDSPASQANRIEEALLALVQSGRLTLPLHRLEVPNIGVLTDLELPHRAYDAAVGTATLADGTRWDDSTVAKQIRGASRKDATALLEHAPLILVLGGWDSHSGTAANAWQGRHEKAVWSKMVAIDAFKMNRPGGRLDPMGLPSSDRVNLSDDSKLTTDEQKAALKRLAEEQNATKVEQGLKKLAKELSDKQASQKLVDQGLGVVPPSMDRFPRLSITMRHAEQRSRHLVRRPPTNRVRRQRQGQLGTRLPRRTRYSRARGSSSRRRPPAQRVRPRLRTDGWLADSPRRFSRRTALRHHC